MKSRESSSHLVIKSLAMRVLYTRMRQPHDITFSLLVAFVCTQLRKITGHLLNIWIKSDFCFYQSILYAKIHMDDLDLIMKTVLVQLFPQYLRKFRPIFNSIVFSNCYLNVFICFIDFEW